jgi:hypothetical protein
MRTWRPLRDDAAARAEVVSRLLKESNDAGSFRLGGGHIFSIDAFVRQGVADSKRERRSVKREKDGDDRSVRRREVRYRVYTTPVYGSSAMQAMAPFTPSSNGER